MKRFHTLGLALAASLAALAPAAAQNPQKTAPPAPPQSSFGEQIEVRVVNVEAVVVDKQGNRVTGLKPADFRLSVDGKPVPVEYFNEVRGGQAIAPGAAEESSPVKGLPSLAPGSPVGTSYLVFIDNFFSQPTRRDALLRDLKGQLAQLGPEDRMAIVAWNGRRVEMLSSWSSSERQLATAIEKAIGEPANGLARIAELRSFSESRRLGPGFGALQGAGSSSASRQLDLDEVEFVERVASQTQNAVSAAASTLRGFAAPPGRKVMLLLAGGWPFSAVDYVINNPNRPITDRPVPSGEEMLKPLVDTANRLGFTLYPVDVPGIEGEMVDASRFGPMANRLNMREQEHEATLLYVAEQTGGKAMVNSASSGLLQTVAADTRSYYWLGFTPAWQGNDKSHKVTLAVLPAGLKVRTRTGFLDLSRKAENSLIVESAMLFGNSPDLRQMPIKLGTPVAAGRRELELPISIALPVDAITFVPLEGKYKAELELRIAVEDAAGRRAQVPVIPMSLTGNDAPKPGTFIRYDTKIKIRKEPSHLSVAVFDPLSGKILLGETDLLPPKK